MVVPNRYPSRHPAKSAVDPLEVDRVTTDRREAAWAGTVGEFLEVDADVVLEDLRRHHFLVMNVPADELQLAAWRDCIALLQSQLSVLVAG
jgi:hypothetical protein